LLKLLNPGLTLEDDEGRAQEGEDEEGKKGKDSIRKGEQPVFVHKGESSKSANQHGEPRESLHYNQGPLFDIETELLCQVLIPLLLPELRPVGLQTQPHIYDSCKL
jgi:hypothetical protein